MKSRKICFFDICQRSICQIENTRQNTDKKCVSKMVVGYLSSFSLKKIKQNQTLNINIFLGKPVELTFWFNTISLIFFLR